MISPPRPLLVMHPHAGLRAALADAAGAGSRMVEVGGWDSLEAALVRLPPTAVAVVDPYEEGPGAAPSPRLRALLDAFPSSAVIAALPVTPATGVHLDLLARWGVADVVELGREDTPAALRLCLRRVRGRFAARLLERAIPRGTPARARALLALAAETAAAGGGSADFAAALGTTERTVLRWCRRADLPDPRRLLTWLRVLLAAGMLDDPGRTLDQVARACGYSGDAALRNAVRGLLGSPPSVLRGRAFGIAAEGFRRELFEAREAGHAAGRPARVWLH